MCNELCTFLGMWGGVVRTSIDANLLMGLHVLSYISIFILNHAFNM